VYYNASLERGWTKGPKGISLAFFDFKQCWWKVLLQGVWHENKESMLGCAPFFFLSLFCLESYGLRASVGSCELANELTLAGQSTRTKGSKICVVSRNPFEGLKYLLLVVHVGFI
jgi:hypothetical protein